MKKIWRKNRMEKHIEVIVDRLNNDGIPSFICYRRI